MIPSDATAVEHAFVWTMAAFAALGAIAWIFETPVEPLEPERAYQGPAQDDADMLMQRIYEYRVRENRKAKLASVKVEHWHADPGSEGRTGKVVQLVVKR